MYNVLPACVYIWLCLLVELSLYEAVLQRPNIIFSANYAIYLTGEAVSLECQATADFTIHGYKFFKNNQEVHRVEAARLNKYKIRPARRNDAGSYTCLYWTLDTIRGRQESEISYPVSLSVIDQPSMPTLLIRPKESLYVEGEMVTLECEHPSVNAQITYRFYKDKSNLLPYQDTSISEHHISSLSTKDSGTYDCEYLIFGHQRIISSGRSKQQTITVTAWSTSPILKFLPYFSTFINGENVTMECEAPSPVYVTMYRFYKEEIELKEPSLNKGIFSLHNLTKANQAEYTCMYWSSMSNREIPSTQSLPKEIYVIDPLRPPFLFSDPPSGRIWDGGNVTLYCRAPEVYERTTFHFLKNRDEIISVSTYKQLSAALTVNMKKSNSTSSTKYICQYTAEIKGRSLLSPKSTEVEIMVVAPGSLLWLIAIGVGAGIAVLIVIVGLLYWALLPMKDKEKEAEESKPIHEGGCKVTSL
ncbi:Fc receptor-like protein 5 [Hyla sarda]|uniref:Fc receptor-like protein 5 n=1 Tax=Hyla sarda TaxID=327740 RepID=UPI0024C38C9B|nr:Fc receptor-like protein 5 [Hyla sarda]XP_056384015.1 Fc receptor-like protein 5 [Hyla sarda]XP_056384024.1 Fc receptor-like protein 5 [Hyla sarda]XP_056384033.1 Fc receptor-like protein 5 [Hyla sarda]XP_056384043.1 Fc receptor-like protein 5 [Hyla sarda]